MINKYPLQHITKRILIMEDDHIFRKTLILEFEERGYQVFDTSGLELCRHAIQTGEKFDFAILDLRLRDGLSLEILKELLDLNPLCKALILTGYPSIASTVQAIKSGAINYLIKPSSIELIEQALWMVDIDQRFNFSKSDEYLQTLINYERELIEFTLFQCDGNITHAAKRLGIHRQSLQRKLKKII